MRDRQSASTDSPPPLSEERREEILSRFGGGFRQIADNIQEVFWMTDGEASAVLYVNPAYEAIWGRSRRSLLENPRSWLESVHPEDRDMVRAAFSRKSLAEGASAEFRISRPDGSVRWVLGRAFPISDGSGRVTAFVGLVKDITLRKDAEQKLRISEALFRSIFEQAAAGMIIVSPRGTFLEANPAFCRMLGYERKELKALDIFHLTHPEDREGARRLFSPGKAERKEFTHNEKRFLKKDGGTIWTDMAGAWIRGPDSEPLYCIALIQDITAQKEAEKWLRNLSRRLLQLQDEERRRIAAELHDSTAQNLVAVVMNLSLAETDRSLPQTVRDTLGESRSLVDRSLQEIRTLSYLLHPPLLDEAGLGSALSWFTDGFAKRSGIEVKLDVDHDLGRLPRELETALFRIVQECLTNIHRHSGSRTAEIKVERRPGTVRLTVSDQGRGMPAGKLARIRAGAPLGVGIAGMRERAAEMGGSLEIDSNKKGTTVRAVVPFSGGSS